MSVQLALESVGYRYPGGHQAVSDIGLSLGAGIVGLLGPNGAGKSSLMRVLATLSRATAGRVTWRGEDIARKPDALRRELGYLPQDFGVYEALSAREFLAFLAAVKGLPAKPVAAQRIGLAGDVLATPGDAAAGGAAERGQHPHQAGLSGAVRPEQADDALAQRQADVGDRLVAAAVAVTH